MRRIDKIRTEKLMLIAGILMFVFSSLIVLSIFISAFYPTTIKADLDGSGKIYIPCFDDYNKSQERCYIKDFKGSIEMVIPNYMLIDMVK